MIPVPIARSRLIQPKRFGEVRRTKSKISGRRFIGRYCDKIVCQQNGTGHPPKLWGRTWSAGKNRSGEREAEAGAESNRTGGSSYPVLGWRLGMSTVHNCAICLAGSSPVTLEIKRFLATDLRL